jgi:hypothetical protein
MVTAPHLLPTNLMASRGTVRMCLNGVDNARCRGISERLHILRGATGLTDKAYESNLYANRALSHVDSLLTDAMQLQGMVTLQFIGCSK